MATEASWGDLFGRRYGAVTVVLAGGVAAHAVNVYLAAAMLPSIVADIGGLRWYAWSTTVFVFASVVGSVFVPRLLAGRGPRGGYWTALGLFAVGTVVCAGAPQITVLLLGRGLQGLGGGLLFGLSYAMIRARLPEALWSRGNALVSAMWGVGTLVGPALGGGFSQLGQWRIAFLVLLPVAALVAALVRKTMPANRSTVDRPPLPALNLAVLAVAVLVVSATSLSRAPAVNLPGIGVAVLLLAVFVVLERRRAPRLLPRRAFAAGSPLRWLYALIALLIIGQTSESFVPLFGQRLAGLPPLAAGFLGAAIAAGWTVGSVASAGTRRVRPAITAAPLLCVLGLAGLAATAAPTADLLAVLAWVALLLVVGLGIGICWPHLTTAAMNSAADPAEHDTAAASITTVQLVATAVGSALCGTLANLAGLDTDPATAGPAATLLYAVLAALNLVAIPLAISTARPSPHRTAHTEPSGPDVASQETATGPSASAE